jgi:predicted PurR-regulated permease PerM
MKVPHFGHQDPPDRPPAPPSPPSPAPPSHALDTDDLAALSRVFSAPRWLRDLGVLSWFLVGAFLVVAGLVALLAVTAEIVGPMIAASIVAVVTSPIVASLARRRVPRAVGAALVLLAAVAVCVVIVVIVIGGITSQGDAIGAAASKAADKASNWLTDVGVSDGGASGAKHSVESAAPQTISTLVHGIVTGIRGIASLAFGLSFAAIGTFFLLKDGPMMRGWVEGHIGVPRPVARTIVGGVITSLRGYFRGVAIIAAFNGVVVGLGAWILGVPLAGTIAVVTFVTAFVPYIGAVVAGFFAVVLALGGTDTQTAAVMLIIVILANGLLQNILQPFVFGATLDLNPLVVLVVTIGSGCLFGMVGLVLAAPLTSAAVHVTRELGRARTEAGLAQPEPAASG